MSEQTAITKTDTMRVLSQVGDRALSDQDLQLLNQASPESMGKLVNARAVIVRQEYGSNVLLYSGEPLPEVYDLTKEAPKPPKGKVSEFDIAFWSIVALLVIAGSTALVVKYYLMFPISMLLLVGLVLVVIIFLSIAMMAYKPTKIVIYNVPPINGQEMEN